MLSAFQVAEPLNDEHQGRASLGIRPVVHVGVSGSAARRGQPFPTPVAVTPVSLCDPALPASQLGYCVPHLPNLPIFWTSLTPTHHGPTSACTLFFLLLPTSHMRIADLEEQVLTLRPDYTLNNPDTLAKYKAAAQISEKVLAAVSALCVAGEKIVTICEKGDQLIEEELGKVYRGKKINKG